MTTQLEREEGTLESLGYQTAVIHEGLPPGRSHIGGEAGGDPVTTQLESLGYQTTVIHEGLPPGRSHRRGGRRGL